MSSKFQYGGQAVIEGVMMRGRNGYSISVRKPDNSIETDQVIYESVTRKSSILGLPFVRGVVALVEALVLGIKALTYSADKSLDEEEEELTTRDIVLTVGLAIVLAIGLFMVLPTVLSHLTVEAFPDPFVQNIIEGTIRIAVFLIYVVAISQMKDIRRVFQYHGAEHKVIHAYEHGVELSMNEIKKIQSFPTLHPRCGTSFLLLVMIVSIIVFALLGEQVLWWRVLSRIILFPVVAGASYEVLKFSARHCQSPYFKWLVAPGLYLQKLTTSEPEDSQVEVALTALNSALLKDGVLQESRNLSAETTAAASCCSDAG